MRAPGAPRRPPGTAPPRRSRPQAPSFRSGGPGARKAEGTGRARVQGRDESVAQRDWQGPDRELRGGALGASRGRGLEGSALRIGQTQGCAGNQSEQN